MITDADIQKLKKVFATKDDLLGMEKRFNKKFATKDDLKAYATKEDLLRLKGDLLGEMSKLRHGILEDLEIFFHDQIMPIFENHDHRITRLEKHTKLPPFAD
jgi:hypothetical protein